MSLYGRYARYYDEDRIADFAALFTDDAPYVVAGVERARGRVAIEEASRAGRAAFPGIRHLISSIVVDDGGRSATGSAYVQAVRVTEAGLVPVTLGTYLDEFALVDGRWRISRHEFVPAGAT
jgi:hypothetical protein